MAIDAIVATYCIHEEGNCFYAIHAADSSVEAPYALARRKSEMLAEEYAKETGLPITIDDMDWTIYYNLVNPSDYESNGLRYLSLVTDETAHGDTLKSEYWKWVRE